MKFTILPLKETNSTNAYLQQLLLQERLPEFTLVTTDYQTSGKGQRGNTWESEVGKNLLFTVLLRPEFVAARSQFLISQITSLAIKEALDCFDADFSIKWPNDIYWREQKICGILIENDLSGPLLSQSLLGIGLNINQERFVSNAPNPVSLKNITGESHDCREILEDILLRLVFYYDLLRKGETELINRRYHESLFRKEGVHLYSDKDGTFLANIVRVDPSGSLILSTETGEIRSYLFKEVQCIL